MTPYLPFFSFLYCTTCLLLPFLLPADISPFLPACRLPRPATFCHLPITTTGHRAAALAHTRATYLPIFVRAFTFCTTCTFLYAAPPFSFSSFILHIHTLRHHFFTTLARF